MFLYNLNNWLESLYLSISTKTVFQSGLFLFYFLTQKLAFCHACVSLEENYLPRVTFIVVQKRHHTPLFQVDHSNRSLTDRSSNILPSFRFCCLVIYCMVPLWFGICQCIECYFHACDQVQSLTPTFATRRCLIFNFVAMLEFR